MNRQVADEIMVNVISGFGNLETVRGQMRIEVETMGIVGVLEELELFPLFVHLGEHLF